MSSGDSETRERILQKTWQLMEKFNGQGVRIEDVARAARISRQAVYLYFKNRTQLLVATARYVDQVNGLNERLQQLNQFSQAQGGVDSLRKFVTFWGNYIPQIYGLARALRAQRETDRAAALAWDDRMQALREGCQCVVDCLEREHQLVASYTPGEAVDLLWGLLSVGLWEDLTMERHWSQRQYLERMQAALQRILVKTSPEKAELIPVDGNR